MRKESWMKKKTSLRAIYFWNLLGNLAAAGSSVLYLMMVSRLTSADTADTFSLANGIAAIWVVIGLFQVRTFQGTDINERYSFTGYALARFLSILLMLVSLYPYLWISGFELRKTLDFWAMTLFVLYRMCDAVSDLFQGLFQQHERLDIAGKSMTIRYTLSVLSLLVGLLLSHSLIFALGLLFLVNLAVICLYDWPQSRAFAKISWDKKGISYHFKEAMAILAACFPLFMSGFLLAYIFNEPKQVIAVGLEQGWLAEGSQRDFSILFMPTFFMSLFILILRPLVTNLAIVWSKQDYLAFQQTSRKLFLLLFLGGGLLTIPAYLIGIPILSLVFGVDLSGQELALAVLVLAGVFYSVSVTIGDLMTIFREQKRLFVIFILIFLTSKTVTFPFIKNSGLLGAGLSFLLVMLTYMLGSFIIYTYSLKKKGRENVH